MPNEVRAEVADSDETAVRTKEQAILDLGEVLAKRKDAKSE